MYPDQLAITRDISYYFISQRDRSRARRFARGINKNEDRKRHLPAVAAISPPLSDPVYGGQLMMELQ